MKKIIRFLNLHLWIVLIAIFYSSDNFASLCRETFLDHKIAAQPNFLLEKDYFEPLIKGGYFISQFGLPDRQKKDAACAAAAITNSTHALYFSLSRGTHAVPESFSLAVANDVWQAAIAGGEIDRQSGIPNYMLPGLMLTAARSFKMLQMVVPIGFSNPKKVRENLQEMLSTPSRIRNIGVRRGSSLHILTVLGFSLSAKKIYVHDPNFAKEILTYDLVIEPDQVKLVPEMFAQESVHALRPLNSGNGELVVQLVFGLNLVQAERAAND